jgi:hypothetical protein
MDGENGEMFRCTKKQFISTSDILFPPRFALWSIKINVGKGSCLYHGNLSVNGKKKQPSGWWNCYTNPFIIAKPSSKEIKDTKK